MADIFSKSKRSEVMSNIKSRGNKKTELALIKLFRKYHITGWRRNRPLFGKPDFVFPKLRVAIFVDGCFWHGCPRCYTRPKSNQEFWDTKIAKNRARDREVNRHLRKLGWKVLRVWEHELKVKNEARLMAKIRQCIQLTDTCN